MVRYGLLGFSQDILEVRQLAKGGGVGPIGPNFERLYWREREGQWSTTPEEPSGGPSSAPLPSEN